MVWGHHVREYLDHGENLFLHDSFLNGSFIDCKDSCMLLVRKYLKEGCRFLDPVEVGWSFYPLVEDVPLAPGRGVFVDLGRGYHFGDSCVCRIIRIRCLSAHVRGDSLQGKEGGRLSISV